MRAQRRYDKCGALSWITREEGFSITLDENEDLLAISVIRSTDDDGDSAEDENVYITKDVLQDTRILPGSVVTSFPYSLLDFTSLCASSIVDVVNRLIRIYSKTLSLR